MPGLRFVGLKSNSIETKQSGCRPKPQIAIPGLGQRAYLTRRSFHVGPAGVVKLAETAITINPIKGDAEKHKARTDPEVESALTACVPAKGPYEIGQSFSIFSNSPYARFRVGRLEFGNVHGKIPKQRRSSGSASV